MPPRRFYLCTGKVVDENKIYEHPSAHILGHLLKQSDEGTNVMALAVYVEPMPTTQVPLLSPKVRVYVLKASLIVCDLCDRRPRWEMDANAQEVIFREFFQRHYPEGYKAVMGEEQ